MQSHPITDILQIKERAAAVRLTMNDVARLAGLPASTAHAKARDGRIRDVRSSTLAKLSSAVIAEELRQRDYLVGLHGLPAEPAVPEAPGNGSEHEPIPAAADGEAVS
ncbi:hypothetical protein [Rhodopseudomonas palustris]|uniref:hypothetical protein n=2 Tax=Rhodopseudomonas TaxID=1073 RepID=UPI000D198DB1|nr:hypothetical protein [Rhodopseudomonas palustris]